MTNEPTTQAGRAPTTQHDWSIDLLMHHRQLHPDCAVADIWVPEAEARDATGLREEAVAVLTLGGRMPSGSGYLPSRGDAVASLRRIAGYEPLRDAAALAAAPPEPRWPSRDELAKALHERMLGCWPGTGMPVVGFDGKRHIIRCRPSQHNADAVAILAALREGGERP